MKKREKILIVIIIIIIVLIIGVLVAKFMQKEDKNSVYYLVTTQKVVGDEVTFLDGISYKLIKKVDTMVFCFEEMNECTEVLYYVNDNTYEIDTWGEDILSGTFFIVDESPNSLVIEKYVDENTKIINYFESKKY